MPWNVQSKIPHHNPPTSPNHLIEFSMPQCQRLVPYLVTSIKHNTGTNTSLCIRSSDRTIRNRYLTDWPQHILDREAEAEKDKDTYTHTHTHTHSLHAIKERGNKCTWTRRRASQVTAKETAKRVMSLVPCRHTLTHSSHPVRVLATTLQGVRFKIAAPQDSCQENSVMKHSTIANLGDPNLNRLWLSTVPGELV